MVARQFSAWIRRNAVPDPSIPFPYSNFIVDLTLDSSGSATGLLGGFQEVTGLPIRVAGMHNVGDVTLKRGIVDSSSLNQWIDAARTNAPSAKRNVSVTQRDESQSTVATWKLVNALPKSFNGPTLGRSTGDIALEELVLSAERIELVTPTPVHSR